MASGCGRQQDGAFVSFSSHVFFLKSEEWPGFACRWCCPPLIHRATISGCPRKALDDRVARNSTLSLKQLSRAGIEAMPGM